MYKLEFHVTIFHWIGRLLPFRFTDICQCIDEYALVYYPSCKANTRSEKNSLALSRIEKVQKY